MVVRRERLEDMLRPVIPFPSNHSQIFVFFVGAVDGDGEGNSQVIVIPSPFPNCWNMKVKDRIASNSW